MLQLDYGVEILGLEVSVNLERTLWERKRRVTIATKELEKLIVVIQGETELL